MDGPQNPQYRLFKYRSICAHSKDYTHRIIADRRIYYAAPTQFNDPFDCDVSVCMDGADLAKHRIRATQEAEVKVRAQEKLRAETNKYFAVLSLSQVNDNLLMWSHYADCHAGVCLEFSFEATAPLHRVEYVERQPRLHFADFDEVGRDSSRFKSAVIEVLTAKAVDWAYEKEWRCIDTDGPGERPMPRDMLTGIIFGCRTSDGNKAMIRDWVASSGRTVNFYQARQRDGAFALDVYPIAR